MTMVRLWIVVALALAGTFVSPELRAAPSKTELQAREAFGASRYQEALDLYAKLYAEKLHPVYLRNIGRCYQNLGEPDKAISSFREYLRKAKAVSKDERIEVEGFIAEMEQLKKDREAAAQVPVAPPPKPAEPPPTVQQPTPPEGNAMNVSSSSTPAPNEDTSLFSKPWFWGVVGAVVIVGVLGGLAAGGAFSGAKDEACGAGRICQ